MEEERIKKIAELRELLEERAKNLEIELDGLRTLLEYLNDILLEKSFKRVEEIAKPIMSKVFPNVPSAPVVAKETKRATPMKTGSGALLATLYMEDGSMRIVPDASQKFDVNTPPFTAFLVEKILGRMSETDMEAVRHGELPTELALSFNIERDKDTIREIIIRNVSPQRERELRSAVRWTLEKMYEKTKSST